MQIVGREPELKVLGEFVAAGPGGGALVLKGGPGVGKTTLGSGPGCGGRRGDAGAVRAAE